MATLAQTIHQNQPANPFVVVHRQHPPGPLDPMAPKAHRIPGKPRCGGPPLRAQYLPAVAPLCLHIATAMYRITTVISLSASLHWRTRAR